MFDDSGAKRFGRIISFIELGLVIALWISYRVDIADTQFFTKIFLISALGIDYIVFVDGISFVFDYFDRFYYFPCEYLFAKKR